MLEQETGKSGNSRVSRRSIKEGPGREDAFPLMSILSDGRGGGQHVSTSKGITY